MDGDLISNNNNILPTLEEFAKKNYYNPRLVFSSKVTDVVRLCAPHNSKDYPYKNACILYLVRKDARGLFFPEYYHLGVMVRHILDCDIEIFGEEAAKEHMEQFLLSVIHECKSKKDVERQVIENFNVFKEHVDYEQGLVQKKEVRDGI